jgi:hypothetical protein
MNSVRRRATSKHLPGAAELAEAGEDQPDCLLDPQIRIEVPGHLAMPDVADRHAEAQLAAPGLGVSGVEHASRSQNAELELADAALHAQQQAIVRPAGVIDAVEIDHACFDQAAQFQQMVPVASVAGKARSVEAEHGADFTGTEPCDQPFEAGSGDHAAGGLSRDRRR